MNSKVTCFIAWDRCHYTKKIQTNSYMPPLSWSINYCQQIQKLWFTNTGRIYQLIRLLPQSVKDCVLCQLNNDKRSKSLCFCFVQADTLSSCTMLFIKATTVQTLELQGMLLNFLPLWSCLYCLLTIMDHLNNRYALYWALYHSIWTPQNPYE